VLVQEGKLAHASLPTWSDDFRDALVLVQEGKLACTSFPPWWNDVVLRCACAFARGKSNIN
jgi:hypothetical protein